MTHKAIRNTICIFLENAQYITRLQKTLKTDSNLGNGKKSAEIEEYWLVISNVLWGKRYVLNICRSFIIINDIPRVTALKSWTWIIRFQCKWIIIPKQYTTVYLKKQNFWQTKKLFIAYKNNKGAYNKEWQKQNPNNA